MEDEAASVLLAATPQAASGLCAGPKVDPAPCLADAAASLQEAADAGSAVDLRRQQLAMREEEREAKEARDAERKEKKAQQTAEPKAKGRPRKANDDLAPLTVPKKRRGSKAKAPAEGEDPEVPQAKAKARAKAKAALRRKSKSKRALETLAAAQETTKKRRTLKYESFTFDKAIVCDLLKVLQKYKDVVYNKAEEEMHTTWLGNGWRGS